ATMSEITVTDMRPRTLRGYGEIDTSTADAVERACDDLEHALQEFERVIAARAESIEDRIARLEEVPFDPRLLDHMARLIRTYGFVEFRPALQSLVSRLEERTFNIALFGRVSSGKSSLLNALLGAPLLPVGVTPITAVPTRVRSGLPARIRVRLEDRCRLPVAAAAGRGGVCRHAWHRRAGHPGGLGDVRLSSAGGHRRPSHRHRLLGGIRRADAPAVAVRCRRSRAHRPEQSRSGGCRCPRPDATIRRRDFAEGAGQRSGSLRGQLGAGRSVAARCLVEE